MKKSILFLFFMMGVATVFAQNPARRNIPTKPTTTYTAPPNTPKFCSVSGKISAGLVKDAFKYCDAIIPNACQVIQSEITNASKSSNYVNKGVISSCNWTVQTINELGQSLVTFTYIGDRENVAKLDNYLQKAKGMNLKRSGY